MSRKRRWSDVRSVGKSHVVPYDEKEDHRTRHERRLNTNLENQKEVVDFCQQYGIKLSITNGGHHWVFLLGTRKVEWWPSTAKMVADMKYNRGVHVHDFKQAMEQLRKIFGLEGLSC